MAWETTLLEQMLGVGAALLILCFIVAALIVAWRNSR